MKHLKLFENRGGEFFTPESLFRKAFQRFAKMNYTEGKVGKNAFIDGNTFNGKGFDFRVNSEDNETNIIDVFIYMDEDEPSYVEHGNYGVRNNKESDQAKRFITSRDKLTPEQIEFIKQIYNEL